MEAQNETVNDSVTQMVDEPNVLKSEIGDIRKYVVSMRVGTPAATTRGLVESDMEQLVAWMDEAIINHNDDAALEKIGSAVMAHMNKFPLHA